MKKWRVRLLRMMLYGFPWLLRPGARPCLQYLVPWSRPRALVPVGPEVRPGWCGERAPPDRCSADSLKECLRSI